MNKTCQNCHSEKPADYFYKSKSSKDGYASTCKICYRLNQKKYDKNRSKDYYRERSSRSYSLHKDSLYHFLCFRYWNLSSRVRVGERNKSKFFFIKDKVCSKDNFVRFGMTNWKLKELFAEWKRLGYPKDKIPSVDRINFNKGYTIDNIQFITVLENTIKGFLEYSIYKSKLSKKRVFELISIDRSQNVTKQ